MYKKKAYKKKAYKKKHHKKHKQKDPYGKGYSAQRGIVLSPYCKNPVPKYIEACLTADWLGFIAAGEYGVGSLGFAQWKIIASPFHPFNDATITGFGTLYVNGSNTENAKGFLDFCTTTGIGSTSGGLYVNYVPLSSKLSFECSVQDSKDNMTICVYPSISGRTLETGMQSAIEIPNAKYATYKTNTTPKKIVCYSSAPKQLGVTKYELLNDLGTYAGSRTTQPATVCCFVVIMQNTSGDGGPSARAWPDSADGLQITMKLQTWVRFMTQANEYMAE